MAKRDLRIGLVLNDFLDRRARGETVSEHELIARHPEVAKYLQRHLAFLRDLEPPGDQIGKLITCGVLAKPADSTCLARLGPYKITGLMGRGGMSVVLRAYEENLGRTVALKLLRPEMTHDGSALKRFVREAKAAAALRHPNIVTVHAVGEEHGTYYIAMEHIDGPSLARLNRDGLPETPTVRCKPAGRERRRHRVPVQPHLFGVRQNATLHLPLGTSLWSANRLLRVLCNTNDVCGDS